MILTSFMVRIMINRVHIGLSAVAASSLLLAACTSSTSSDSGADLEVSAAFYPLAYVAQTVGGDHVKVTSLAGPGVEPHDLELSPAAVRDLGDSDVVLFIGEFQAAVDDAISTTGAHSFDAASVVNLHEAHEEEGHDEEAGEEGHDDEGHDHGSKDPHFWLEPALLATYAEAVGEEFASLDAANAADYRAHAKELAASLNSLDEEFVTGLATCERRDIVTSHEAFGYLAEAYDLTQVGLAGLDPEAEPSPARLREVKDLIEQTGATTVFTEALVSPKVAEALAADAGAQTAVLDPIESVADGDDYIKVMTRNLEALRTALACD